MLITDKFTMLNFPKTGSTFARKAIFQANREDRISRVLCRLGLRQPPVSELLMLPYFFTAEHTAVGSVAQHGTLNQIPKYQCGKAIMTVVRDPLTRIVSLFEYRDWQRRHFPNIERLMEWFPNYPELSFEEFLTMHELTLPYATPKGMNVNIGPLTTQFIRFYARDPLKTILALREDTNLRQDYDLHFPKIHFLHTESLNQELYDFLFEMGYAEQKIAFIKNSSKQNTSKRRQKEYLTDAHIAMILKSERFFYQLFPEYLNNPA